MYHLCTSRCPAGRAKCGPQCDHPCCRQKL